MITEISLNDIPQKQSGRKCGVFSSDIKSFIESDARAVMVDVPKGKNVRSVRICYYNAATLMLRSWCAAKTFTW